MSSLQAVVVATIPVGLLEAPNLVGSLGAAIHDPVLAGTPAAAASPPPAILLLSRYSTKRTLLPFAVYSLVLGGASAIRFGIIF